MSIASSTVSTRMRCPILTPPLIIQFMAVFHNDQCPSTSVTYLSACDNHMTILRRYGPPLQWKVVTLDAGIGDRSVVRPWYDFLNDTDFDHGDEVSFYYRHHEKNWEMVIRRQKDWEDSNTY
ncbi:hypothetical protein JHK84_045249 [Glycine max]|nr:hypothetical protein JHK86_045193 [Glycine max]KAG5108342.1 hypothetical protein JHK84_045249 [Glycine max]